MDNIWRTLAEIILEAGQETQDRSFGVMPLGWFESRSLKNKRIKMTIRGNGKASYKRGCGFEWDLEKTFKPSKGWPRFIAIKVDDICRVDDVVCATLITIDGRRIEGTIYIDGE